MRSEPVVLVRTIMPHALGVAPVRRDPPETRRLSANKEEDGRAPYITASGVAVYGNPVGSGCGASIPDPDALWQHTGFNIAPQRDQQLPGHGDNGDAPRAALQRADARAEPCSQRTVRLVAQPQPGELDKHCAGTRIVRG